MEQMELSWFNGVRTFSAARINVDSKVSHDLKWAKPNHKKKAKPAEAEADADHVDGDGEGLDLDGLLEQLMEDDE
eukprot:505475-Pyramimonas_sp.AAC.1